MNKRLRKLVIATASLMLVESSPIAAVRSVYAAVDNAAEKTEAENKSKTDTIDESIAKVNAGNEDLSDYENLEVKDVSYDNLACIQYSVKKAKENNSGDLTKEQLKKTVEKTLLDISNAKNNIYLGRATIEDYEILQVTAVNNHNIEDVNSILTGTKMNSVTKIRSEVQGILDTLRKVDAGDAELNDYYSLRIKIENQDYISIINKNIKNSQAKSTLTIKDVQSIVDKVNANIKAILERVYKGEATVDDYKYICSFDVNETNIDDVNEWMQNGKTNSYKKVVNEVEDIVSILERINNGEETEDDYYDLDIEDVDYSNIDTIKKANAVKRQEKGSNLTKQDITDVVNEVVTVIDLLEKINKGNATVEDYVNAGITGVNEENISDINKEISGKELTTISEIQNVVNSVNEKRNLNALFARIKEGTATLDDYTSIAVSGVNADNITFINNKLKGNAYTSVEEVQTAVDENVKLFELLTKVNAGEATVSDYESLGITVVTDKNLSEVNVLVKGKNFEDKETVKAFIDSNIDAINAKINLNEVLSKVKEGTATVEDYASIGVSGVNTDNITFVNNSLKGNAYTSVEEVQASVNESIKVFETLVKVNAGEAVVSDYESLGITVVTEKNLSEVNALVKGKNFTDKKALKTFIDGNIDAVNAKINLSEVLAKVKEGTATVDDYVSIGVSEVNADNLTFINNNLKGNAYTSAEEVQAAVNENVKLFELLAKVNAGEAVVADYESLGITVVTDKNLSEVNALVKGKNFEDKETLKAFINSNIDVVNAKINLNEVLEKIKEGTAKVEDYVSIGVSGVDTNNLIFVNNSLKGNAYTSAEEVQAAVNESVKVFDTLVKVNKGIAEVLDYDYLGITSVTDKNLSEVNNLVKGKNFTDKLELKQYVDSNIVAINAKINLNEVLVNIKEGTATVEDYASIGISGVDTTNVTFINDKLKGNNYTSAEEVQTAVNDNVKLLAVLTKINAGEAEVADYETLGITVVTEKNLNEVNSLVKGKNFEDQEALKSYIDSNIDVINAKINLTEVLEKIKEGTAVVEDYESMGVSGVDANNIEFINNSLKEKEYASAEEVQEVVNKTIELKNAITRIENGEGTLHDYQVIGVNSVTDTNLEYVNYDIKGKTYSTIDELKNALNAIVEVDNRYIKINNGEGTIEDYQYLGIEGVTAENIDYINSKVKGNININAKNLQEVVTNALKDQGDKPDPDGPYDDGFDIYIYIRDFWGHIIKIIRRVRRFFRDIFGGGFFGGGFHRFFRWW